MGDLSSTIADAVHERLLAGTEVEAATSGGVTPAQRRVWLREMVRGEAPLLGHRDIDAAVATIEARLDGLGLIEPLLADPQITEVMVNGGGSVWIERSGSLECTGMDVDERTTLHLIERIVAPLGLHVDRSSPMVDARLDDGSRVNAVLRPLAVDGPCLTIRRFGARRIALDEMADAGVVELLRWAVRARMNILVSGGAGSGKTTLLNALGAQIPSGERIVTIEDAAELRLPGDHVIRLESRPANTEGAGEVRVRDLVRNALRMRPDRIVVGEVRSGEAIDMLQAMNTGHDGSLSTCHANSPLDALRRIETLVLMGDVGLPHVAVREQVVSALDLVVHMGRDSQGRRFVTELHEVGCVDADGALVTRPLMSDGALVALPSRPPRRQGAGAPA